ncbi:MAG TPA: 50S ribosomal protein L11 methyltransferase [Myxococcota bacterium]|nr:50S ribosomal protein L11 methyltransferase [Myxococcota bacterium]
MSSWVELRAVVARSSFERLSALAFELGASGVEEAAAPGSPRVLRQPWDTVDAPLPFKVMLRAWFAEPARDRLCCAFSEAGCADIELLDVHEEDWAETWKHHHKRIEISSRLRVSPPWCARPGDLVIPPGNAFGTGDHPTTAACLAAIDELANSCRSCLDVGCGSGVLALSAAKLGMTATGIDIDPAAVETARDNAAANQLAASFSGIPLASVEGRFDLVVANVFAEVLTELAPDLVRVTGRHLVLAGILTARAEPVLAALSPPLAVRRSVEEGDWLHLHLERL